MQIFARYDSKGLHRFEFAQLINLKVDTVDEAYALIPSLRLRVDSYDPTSTNVAHHFGNDDLEFLIEELKSLRKV